MAIRLATKAASLQNVEGISGRVFQIRPHAADRSHALIIWITLIGILSPPIPISVGDLIFTPGRMVVAILFVPALVILLRNSRGRVASDFFAIAAATWMIGSSILNGGFRPYVGAEALDFLGAYLVGRAFFFGPINLQSFSRAFKFAGTLVIALAVLDTVSGGPFTLTQLGIWPDRSNLANLAYRYGLARATSIFEHAEMYGTFCAAAAAIFFYSARTNISRIFYVGLSFFGVVLSLSSGPLLGAAIVIGSLCYDRVLKLYPWRWTLLVMTIAGLTPLLFLVSNNPIVWIITHLTFNPETGFFRIMTWNVALQQIDLSPWLGYGLTTLKTSDDWWWLFLSSVDCLWLVEALRYGLPTVLFLTLTIFWPFLRSSPADNMRTGLSLAVVTMVLVGFTVHFWDSMWLFFNLCVGIRVSFAERVAGRRVSQRSAH